MSENIADSDVVSRSVINPKDFDEFGVLCLRKSFTFSSGNNYLQSVNCNRLLGYDVNAIHILGLKKQELDHQRGQTHRQYVGYVEANVENIRSISINEGQASFAVCHHEENGNYAHCHIELRFLQKQKNVLNLAVNKLCDVFSDLIPYGT